MEIRDKVNSKSILSNTLVIGISTFLFLLSIQLLGQSFSLIGKDYAQYILDATSNPSVGLFIGLLSTAILQSSSTTTSMAVAAVAAGTISLNGAIPIIMGANIGTTLTSTIVSMSYVTRTAEFRKAIAAGTSHDIFNVLTALIIFPLEIRYGFLSQISLQLASLMDFSSGDAPVANNFFIYRSFNYISFHLIDWFGPYATLILSVILLFAIVKFISNIIYKKLIGQTKSQFETVIFKNTYKSFGWGFLLTSAIQSSSLTTSLIVPLVATGKVQLKRAFEFILGANLGTTITALLAAVFKSEAAISLAIAHFIFNLLGITLFLAIPVLKRLPLFLSNRLGSFSTRYRFTAFAYILIVFFILPFTLIYFSKKSNVSTFNATKAGQTELLNK